MCSQPSWSTSYIFNVRSRDKPNEKGTHVVNGLCLNPDRCEGCGLDNGANLRHCHFVCLRLRLRQDRCLNDGHLIRNSGSQGVLNGLGPIDNFCADPDLCVCRWLHDGRELSLGYEVGECFLECRSGCLSLDLSNFIGLRRYMDLSLRSGLRVDVDLRLGLGCSQRVQLSDCVVDDFCRYPHTRCWDEER